MQSTTQKVKDGETRNTWCELPH